MAASQRRPNCRRTVRNMAKCRYRTDIWLARAEGRIVTRTIAWRKRGARNRKNLPLLTTEQIVAWANAYYKCAQQWPKRDSGPIQDAPGETWKGVDMALVQGCRGFPGGSSLPKFLEEHFGVRNEKNLPRLTEDWICERANAHKERTGSWPTETSGQIVDAPEETWKAMQVALYQGRRGLPGGSTLPRLLERHFGVPIRGGRDRQVSPVIDKPPG